MATQATVELQFPTQRDADLFITQVNLGSHTTRAAWLGGRHLQRAYTVQVTYDYGNELKDRYLTVEARKRFELRDGRVLTDILGGNLDD